MLGVWFGALCWQQHFRLFSDGPQLKVPSVADAMQWTVNTDVASCCLVGFSHACAECTFRHTVSRCGPQAVKQTITWVPVRASGCETDHYLGSDDGPQAVKQTITWVLMTGLRLWNRPLPGFWWRASSCETDHYCYLGFRWRASPLWDLCIWLHGQYVCRMNLETCTSVSGRLNRNINNDDTNETVYKTRKTFQLLK